ncbi:MAG: hypothetical protein LBG95_08525 [Treponema sp.]|jgi:putative aldouronate transport system substrate-binding protein|nr:hypothetical protein [Treponema sp.]
MKKITFLLSLVLVLVLAGCTGKGTKGKVDESKKEHHKISIAVWEINPALPKNTDDPLRKFVEDKFNISLEGGGLSWADDVPQVLSLWAATGQLPDVFGGDLCLTAQYRQWVEDGVIRSIPESMYRKYPNINNAVKNDPAVQSLMVNGELYFLPRVAVDDIKDWFMERGILNRKDWREKLGFDKPRTKQDFIDLCKAYATMNPKGDGSFTVGMSFDAPNFIFDQTFSTFGMTSFNWIRDANGMYYMPAFESEGAYNIACWLRDMNKAGGLDPDLMSYIQNAGESGLSNFVNGKIGMLCIQVSPARYLLISTPFIAANRGVEFKDLLDYFEILDPPVDGGNAPVGLTAAGYWSESYINANVSDAKLERILQLFDWMMSDEAMNIMNMGLEGIDWKRGPDGDFIIINENVNGKYPILSTSGFINLASWFSQSLYTSQAIPKSIRDYTREVHDYRMQNWELAPLDYSLALETIPERDALGALGSFGMNYWAPFIFDKSGATNEALYAKLKADMDAAGYKAAKDAMNARAKELGIK